MLCVLLFTYAKGFLREKGCRGDVDWADYHVFGLRCYRGRAALSTGNVQSVSTDCLQIQGKGKRQGKAAGARRPGVLRAGGEVGAGAGKGLLWHPLVLPRLMLRAGSTGTAGYP